MKLLSCRLLILSTIVLPCAGRVLRKRDVDISTLEFGRAVKIQENKIDAKEEWPRDLVFETLLSLSMSLSFSYQHHQGIHSTPSSENPNQLSPAPTGAANISVHEEEASSPTSTPPTNLTCNELPSTSFDAVLEIVTPVSIDPIDAAGSAFHVLLEHLIRPCQNSTEGELVESTSIKDIFLGDVLVKPLTENCTTSLQESICQVVNLKLILYGDVKEAILKDIPVVLMDLYHQKKWEEWLASRGILKVELAELKTSEATEWHSSMTADVSTPVVADSAPKEQLGDKKAFEPTNLLVALSVTAVVVVGALYFIRKARQGTYVEHYNYTVANAH